MKNSKNINYTVVDVETTIKHKITQEELKTILDYNPETGDFVWLVKTGRKNKVGFRAGNFGDPRGYIRISINGTRYYAHQLAWLYMTGEFPTKTIDHINRIKSDNRFINLRHVSYQENNQNILANGCYYDSKYGKWRAQIYVNNHNKSLGSFTSKELAIEAYIVAKRKYHGGYYE